MPRLMAPPPSGEFYVALHEPFEGQNNGEPAASAHAHISIGKPTKTVRITGEPNRPATIVTTHDNGSSIEEKDGQMSAEDVNELLRLVDTLRGFPSDEKKDVYGLNARLEVHTFDINWANQEADPAADVVSDVAAETKSTFSDVVKSVQAAGRQFARKDRAI